MNGGDSVVTLQTMKSQIILRHQLVLVYRRLFKSLIFCITDLMTLIIDADTCRYTDVTYVSETIADAEGLQLFVINRLIKNCCGQRVVVPPFICIQLPILL